MYSDHEYGVYGDTSWGDLLTSYNGKTISYDNAGNPLNWRNADSLTWQGRQLASVKLSNGSTLSFTYNADGIRVGKVDNAGNTVSYIVDGSKIVAEQRDDGKWLYYIYDENGAINGISYGGTWYVFRKNIQGDITGIYNEACNLIAQYSYTPYGEIIAITDAKGNDISSKASHIANLNPFRYRGYYYDTETGFYYTAARYYDSVVGRFISSDLPDVLTATPMALTDKNLYAYCDNNPVMREDKDGGFWHIAIGAVVGGLIGGVVKVFSNVIEGRDITDGLGTAMLAGAASGALATTGVGLVGMTVGNAAISMAENAANQVIANKGFNNFDVGDMVTDGVIGGVSGAMGRAGRGSKHLTNLGKQTVKRTINATANKGVKAGIKEAGKAFAYYGKNTVKYYKSFIRKLQLAVAICE